MKQSSNFFDHFYTFIVYSILAIISLLVLIPILYTFSVSVTPYADVIKRGGVVLWPSNFTIEYYRYVLRGNSPIIGAYGISAIITVAGTFISLFLTVLTAYPLSKKRLSGRNFFMGMFFFTMLFSGGIIPTYLVVRNMNLIDTLWALMIPSAMSVYNMIIMRSFFVAIPDSLEESATIDGCNDIGVLFRIVLPLSKPALATIGLFYAVTKWNMFFDAMIYINDRSKYTLQIVLREVLLLSQMSEFATQDISVTMPPLLSVQMASTTVAIIPMLVLYPILQRHFVQGVMIGAIKG